MPIVKCEYCGKKIEKNLYHINRAKNNFCSIYCKSKYQNKMNIINLKQDHAEIIIKKDNKDLIILIDLDDVKKVNKYKWNAKYDETINNYYIHAWERNKSENNRKRIILHRYLMNTPENMQTDHINRNTLDNRKCNLRNVTLSENLQNKGFYKNNKSGYKYIYWHKTFNCYKCEIKRNKKIIFSKLSKNLQELVMLRNKFLKEVM